MRSILTNAIFQNADLRGANFYRAHMSQADFQDADLRNAEINLEQLEEANDLYGVRMPDGTNQPGRSDEENE